MLQVTLQLPAPCECRGSQCFPANMLLHGSRIGAANTGHLLAPSLLQACRRCAHAFVPP